MATVCMFLLALLLLYLPNAKAQTISNYKSFLYLFPYNVQHSKMAAAYSSVAYCSNQCVNQWSCAQTQHYPKLLNVTSFQNISYKIKGYIGYLPEENKIVIAFRGTHGAHNWFQNLNACKQTYPLCFNCSIHQGFYKDYKSISSALQQNFQHLLSAQPTATVLITGHSLGGALSTIAGIQFHHKYGVKIQIHTFGAPRVGNSAFAAYVNNNIENVYRVVHDRDMVPHVPPMRSGYRHPAYEIFWDEDFSRYRVCAGDGEDKSCSNDYIYHSIEDHGFYFIEISKPQC